MALPGSYNPVLTLLPNLLLILAVATGIVITEPSLPNDRKLRPVPEVEEKDKNPNSYFWEDPLKGIAAPKKVTDSTTKPAASFRLRWGAEMSFGNPRQTPPAKETAKHASAEKEEDKIFTTWFKRHTQKTSIDLVMVVGMEGGPNPADLERRIRTRLAVASALSGRAEMLKCPKMGLSRWSFEGLDEDNQKMKYAVAMECFSRPSASLCSTSSLHEKYLNVAVVYVDESNMVPSPGMMENLRKAFGGNGAPLAYIGISRSGHLRDFLIKSKAVETLPLDQSCIRIYSPHATVDGKLLDLPQDERNRVAPVNDSFLGPHYRFSMDDGYGLLTRVGADDGELAKALVAELVNRGVPEKPEDAVLLLADMDRYHSRVLVKSFEKGFLPAGKQDPNFGLSKSVRVIHYPEGLDALGLAQSSSPAGQAGNSSPQGKAGSQSHNASRGNPGGVHAAEGFIQFDSLARLPARIRELEREDHVRYRAIGLFGSDVHDKLQILRALRPGFPQALFFTNDLDARLWQGENRGDSINLLVAGAFGLSMDGEIQGSVAPFRSSYQTATYLACLHAVGYSPDADTKLNWLESDLRRERLTEDEKRGDTNKPPNRGLTRAVELHEVGRTGDQLLAFHLPAGMSGKTMQKEAPGRPVSVQRESPGEKTAHRYFQLVIFILFSVILWQIWSPSVRNWWASENQFKEEQPSAPRIAHWAITVAVIALCGLAWNVAAVFDVKDGTNEGGAIFAGVSAKPVIAANFLIIAISLAMVFVQFRRLQQVYPYPFRKPRLPQMPPVLGIHPILGHEILVPIKKEKLVSNEIDGKLDGNGDGLPYTKHLPSLLDITGWLTSIRQFIGCGQFQMPLKPSESWQSRLLAFIRNGQGVRRQESVDFLDAGSPAIQWAYARERLAVSNWNVILRVSGYIILGIIAFVLLIGFRESQIGTPSSVRGAHFRLAFSVGDGLSKLMLVVLAGIAFDRQLALLVGLDKLARFLTRRSLLEEKQAEQNVDDLPPPYPWHKRPEVEDIDEGDAKKRFGIPDSGDEGFWEMPLLRTAAMRFSEVTPCMVMPFVLAFLILVIRHPVFENITLPPAELALFGFILLAPMAAGLLAQHNMARVFAVTKTRIRRAQRFVSPSGNNSEREKFLKSEMESADELEKRTKYGFFGNPLFEAILLPLGGYGILEFSSIFASMLK